MYDVDTETWQKFVDKSQDKINRSKKKEIVQWLGCSQNSTILESFMRQSIEAGSKFDTADVIKSVINGSPLSSQVALDFMITNLKKLIQL